MSASVLGNLVTVCVFLALGASIARRSFRGPVRATTWVALVLAGVFGSFVGRSTSILCIHDVAIRLNWAISCCCLGILIALLVRTSRASGPPVAP